MSILPPLTDRNVCPTIPLESGTKTPFHPARTPLRRGAGMGRRRLAHLTPSRIGDGSLRYADRNWRYAGRSWRCADISYTSAGGSWRSADKSLRFGTCPQKSSRQYAVVSRQGKKREENFGGWRKFVQRKGIEKPEKPLPPGCPHFGGFPFGGKAQKNHYNPAS
jgi:hypothetical protein